MSYLFSIILIVGADGGLEFGVLRVFEEQKQTMSLKNRGKYEIGYKYYSY